MAENEDDSGWHPLMPSAEVNIEVEKRNNPFLNWRGSSASMTTLEDDEEDDELQVQSEKQEEEGDGDDDRKEMRFLEKNRISPPSLPPPPPPPRKTVSQSVTPQELVFVNSEDATQGSRDAAELVSKVKAKVGKDSPEQRLMEMANVMYTSADQDSIRGVLELTNFRLSFSPGQQGGSENWFFQDKELFDIPLGAIEKISRTSGNQVVSGRSKDSIAVYVTCKDFRRLHFRFPTTADAIRVHDLLKLSAFPVSMRNGDLQWLFALDYGKSVLAKGGEQIGWRMYSPRKEWVRLGLLESVDSSQNKFWRITGLNRSYNLCPSYPGELLVPSSISDEDLHAMAPFRSRCRIPALTWYSSISKGSIWRASQPKVGLGNNFNRHDEKLWSEVVKRSGSNGSRVVDCRPFKNALGNKAKGYGYEEEARYPGISVSFHNIANIHIMRNSMGKLLSLVLSSSSTSGNSGTSSPGYDWHQQIESTGWLNHIRAILSAAISVAKHVACRGFAVLIHCSDGWDRTSQVSAVAQVLLDSYYRTIEGFQILIDKDWLSFGFQFMSRTGHGIEDGTDERSPCFLQFIDAIWQLLQIFPTMFEFNEEYLMEILTNLYSCRFGTFLCDSEMDRARHAIPLKTVSLWDHIEENRECFLNILYGGDSKKKNPPIIPHPVAVARQVKLWDKYYLRFASVPSLNAHAFSHHKDRGLRLSLRTRVEESENRLKKALQDQATLEERILNDGTNSPSTN